MTLTADLESIAHVERSRIARRLGLDEDVSYGSVRSRGLVVPTLAMSAAGAAAMMVASTIRHGTPWSAINVVPRGIGLVGRRPRRRFDASLALTTLGLVVGASLLISAVDRQISRRARVPRIGGPLIASVGSYLVDRYVLRRTLVPALTKELGPVGLAAMYAAMGLGALIGRR